MQIDNLKRLREKFVDDDPQNFFHEWDRIFSSPIEVTVNFYERLDSWMSHIPDSEWEHFERKIEPVYRYCDLNKNRHWEKLFDVFNESFGFYVLSERYNCNNLRFYEQEGKAPDIIGWADGIPHFIEVKTINNSQEERDSWYDNTKKLSGFFNLPDALKRKIEGVYKEAIDQLKSTVKFKNKKNFVGMIIKVDYNIPDFPDTITKKILDYLDEIEDEEYFIEFIANR